MLRAEAMLEPGDSLGRHLAARRQVLGHRQKDAAAALGVDPKTWMWWERDEHAPYVHQYPALSRYLGYEPWPEPASFGERLLVERRRRGLSIVKAAELVGVDEGAWRRWERGEWKVTLRTAAKLSRFLDCSIETAFPDAVR